MTRQTAAPLTGYSLNPSPRMARDVMHWRELGLDLSPAYQRGSVWNEDQRINLVRSWLTGVPAPAVTLNDRFISGMVRYDEAAYGVIDGKQRIETALAWFDGELAVPASWFNPDHVETTVDTDDGAYVTFKGLTTVGQRRVSNRAMLPVIEVKFQTIQEEAALYVLIEQSGTKHSAEDVARAQNIASL